MRWITSELGKIIKMTSGGTPDKKHPEYYDGGTIPWVRSGELDKGIILDTELKITEAGLANSSAKLFPKGTLLIAMYGATIGKLSYLGIEAATNQAICAMFENETISLKYLYYYLLYQRPNLVKQGIGGAQPNISQTILKKMVVRYPDNLADQEKLVERIEELLSELDDGLKTLQITRSQLDIYRETVLQKAFSQSRYGNEWESLSLSDQSICSINPKTDIPDFSNDDDVSFLPMPSVFEKVNRFSPELAKYEKVRKGYTRFKDKDILFAKITPCMENGKICIVDNLIKGVGFGSTEFHVLRCTERMIPKYLFYFISRDVFRMQAKTHMTGSAGQKRVPSSYLEKQNIPVPSLQEQEEVVNYIETKLSVCYGIEQTIEKAIAQSHSTRESVLKTAFEGRLI